MAAFAVLCAAPDQLHAQQQTPPAETSTSPAPTLPKGLKLQPHAELTVTKAQYNAEGILVLCVRVTAKNGDVALGSAGDAATGGGDTSLSMEACYLENQSTRERINALPELPNAPHFGPMVLLSQVQQGHWLELGVAFPRLPAPKDPGKPETYKLYVPLKTELVDIKELPTPPAPKAKAKPAAR